MPKLCDSSRKITAKEERNTMSESFVERKKEAWNRKLKKGSVEMLKTRLQNVAEKKRTTLIVEVHWSLAHDEGPAERGNERNGTRLLAIESTPIGQGQRLLLRPGLLIEKKSLNRPKLRLKIQWYKAQLLTIP